MTATVAIQQEEAFKPGSILVFEGYKMTREQVEHLKAQFREAAEKGEWPLLLSSQGPVYFASERDRKSHEFTEFVASLDLKEASEALSVITVRSLIEMAKEALQ